MAPELESTPIFKWLKRQDVSLAERVGAVRDELMKWLPQIVLFFSHYSSHGVDHSDRIVAQLSKLLFISRGKLAVPFSPGEIYCLLCAAYLHDIGMVASPGEMADILDSAAWKEFVADGNSGHEAFQQYEGLRAAAGPATKEQAHFFADIALRQLLAEYVRTHHHERGKSTLEMHPFLRQLVDHGDSVAFETISALGVGHGLASAELTDASRFPEERDVLGDKVNVRFLARLLRIGDLLDMDSRRADPMTAKAVAPLPPGAIPHWKQYSTKKHENISSKEIAYTFECDEQETHRVLRDWFGWLESEVHEAGLEQLHATRHSGWKVPRCIVSSQATPNDGNKTARPTIIIRPASGANYTFHDWKFELDHEQILERLIYDVNAGPLIFVRELVQNALDATRCQMYSDFAKEHPDQPLPERPTQFPAEFRERYPVILTLAEEDVKASPDAKPEKRMVFTIEDCGTGMNEDIIKHYFLQVGRSYYRSNDFREHYKFAPTSRFGVGFLSVFAVSKAITVNTARRDDASGTIRGLRLSFREPRSYLLTEPWPPFEGRPETSRRTGTRIRVVLEAWEQEASLVNHARELCVAVEVPVVVREAEQETVIHGDRLIDRTVLAISKMDPDGRFILRTFDFNTHGVEGQVAVIAYEDDEGEGWCDCWPDDEGLDGKRMDRLPKFPRGFRALHGIRFGGRYRATREEQWIFRSDVRSAAGGITMARAGLIRRGVPFGRHGAELNGDRIASSAATLAVQEAAMCAVRQHLAETSRADGKRGITYKGQVLSDAPVADDCRDQYAETVVTWRDGRREDISVEALLALEEFVFPAWEYSYSHTTNRGERLPMKQHPKDRRLGLPIVSYAEVPGFARDRFLARARAMELSGVESHEDLWLLTFSGTPTTGHFERAHDGVASWVGPLSLSPKPGVRLDVFGYDSNTLCIYDRDSPAMQWFSALRIAAAAGTIPPAVVEASWLSALHSSYRMTEVIRRWAEDPEVPNALRPPEDLRNTPIPLRVLDLYCRPTIIDN